MDAEMRQYHPLSRSCLRERRQVERWLQDARDYVRALCEACLRLRQALVMNPLFFFALLLDCLALVVLWFVGLQ